jgi:hypothetical protein
MRFSRERRADLIAAALLPAAGFAHDGHNPYRVGWENDGLDRFNPVFINLFYFLPKRGLEKRALTCQTCLALPKPIDRELA